MKTNEDYLNFSSKIADDFYRYFKDFNCYNFTTDELIKLGWVYFDDELLLMPPRFLSVIKSGTKLKSINSTYHISGKDYIDDDTRGGFTAYGITEEMLNIYKIKKREEVISDITSDD